MDRELKSMDKIVSILECLDWEAKFRVVDYLSERYLAQMPDTDPHVIAIDAKLLKSGGGPDSLA